MAVFLLSHRCIYNIKAEVDGVLYSDFPWKKKITFSYEYYRFHVHVVDLVCTKLAMLNYLEKINSKTKTIFNGKFSWFSCFCCSSHNIHI